jgi:hypothetical protein
MPFRFKTDYEDDFRLFPHSGYLVSYGVLLAVKAFRNNSANFGSRHYYSITSSASASIAGGTSIPSTLAVLRLRQK